MIEYRLDNFYLFVREERLFCAALAHLLLQRGPNLGTFLQLVNAKLPTQDRISAIQPDEAQIYLEFSYLRDYWDTLAADNDANDAKRKFIFTILSRIPELEYLRSQDFPASIPEFNGSFMGPRGFRVLNDIVYPGRWSVAALKTLVFDNPEGRFAQLDPRQRKTLFQTLCKFKWAFNIKPDMVLLFPDSPPICVEAKLESREGSYPSTKKEQLIFNDIFGPGQGRVGQLELQRFMFQYHLAAPCRSVVIGRAPLQQPEEPSHVFLSWDEVFGSMDTSSSLAHVRRLLEQNEPLRKP